MSFDDFPDHLAQPAGPRKDFSFNEHDDEEEEQDGGDEVQDDESEADDEQPEETIVPLHAEEAPAQAPAFEENPLAAAATRLLGEPAVATLIDIRAKNYGVKAPTGTQEGDRISRSWLNSMTQRQLFMAIGYPGHMLQGIFEFEHSLRQIRRWVDGSEAMPTIHRRLLTTEFLLERRTHNQRRRLPTRQEIQAGLDKLTSFVMISDLLGGFEKENNDHWRFDKEKHELPPSTAARGPAAHEDLIKLKVERTGRSSNLPINPRLRGEGRPLGQKLQKPSTNCYNMSRKTKDPITGIPAVTAIQYMGLINQAAELETRYGVPYSITKKDKTRPYSMDNFELIPSLELEKRRGRG